MTLPGGLEEEPALRLTRIFPPELIALLVKLTPNVAMSCTSAVISTSRPRAQSSFLLPSAAEVPPVETSILMVEFARRSVSAFRTKAVSLI